MGSSQETRVVLVEGMNRRARRKEETGSSQETRVVLVEGMNRRARRKEETLRRIEDAGWRLFRSRGFEATSTRAIAEAADIAAGTLFNYFPEKRSLLIHLMQGQINTALDEAFATMTASTLEQELTYVFSALTRCYAKERRLSRVFIKELLFTDGQRRAESAEWTFNLVKRVANMVGAPFHRKPPRKNSSRRRYACFCAACAEARLSRALTSRTAAAISSGTSSCKK